VTALGASDATVFGASVQRLIDNLELGGATPLFWVAFDSVAPTSFTPGPGQTTLALGITLRPGESAEQIVQFTDVGGAVCPHDVVSVPVRVALATADGSLDDGFDATLEFTNASVAHVSGQLPTDGLTGTFGFGQIGDPAQGWQAQSLSIDMALWPGGSRGAIRPELRQAGPPTPPSMLVSPAITPADAPTPTPFVPDHWSAVAVWPRREVCPNDGRGGVVFDAADPLIGASPLDVVDALGRDAAWSLASAGGDAPVHVTLEAPSGLVCVSTDAATLELDVQATLRADGAAAGSALEHLDASTILRVGARAAADGSGLVELHWVRRDAVWGQPRGVFEEATGLTLDAVDEYRDIWWSWHGLETRADAAAAWSTRAELVVSSLNAEQAADIARIVAQGGPGASIGFDADGLPLLPGDILIDAEASP
jgi:hypothetical protein